MPTTRTKNRTRKDNKSNPKDINSDMTPRESHAYDASHVWRRRFFFSAGFCLMVIVGNALSLLPLFEYKNAPEEELVETFIDPNFEGWLSTLGIGFIVMGHHATKSASDIGIRSLRDNGKWEGHVFVVTDSPGCFEDIANKYNTEVIEVDSVDTEDEIAAIKCKLISLLPSRIRTVLYLDMDVLTTKNLLDFLQTTHATLLAPSLEAEEAMQLAATDHYKPLPNEQKDVGTASIQVFHPNLRRQLIRKKAQELGPIGDPNGPQLALFQDAGGHTFGNFAGMCSECDKWHAGVVLMIRGVSETCLDKWLYIMESGRFKDDQQALDHLVDSSIQCSHILKLPSKDLLFMKDYPSYMFGKKRTFSRFTGFEHQAPLLSSDWLYWKWVVMPTLHTLNMKGSDLTANKQCTISNIPS